MIGKLLSFKDLTARGICSNRTQLRRMIDHIGFPVGFKLSPNARRWTEAEIEAWLRFRAERLGQLDDDGTNAAA